MSLLQLFSNNAVSLLNAPISASSTSLQVQPGLGALFPQPSQPGEFFLVTLETIAAPFNREIIKVTGRSGDTLTFSLADRAQEGTVAQAWAANDTLVDHRATAETYRAAMRFPQLSLDELSDVAITSQNNGDVLTWDGANWVAQQPSSGNAWINGDNSGPILVDANSTTTIDSSQYSSNNRTFKYIITFTDPISEIAGSFECLANISGRIAINAETVSWNKYSFVGNKFRGNLLFILNTASKIISVRWNNLESFDVSVSITRIQHAP